MKTLKIEDLSSANELDREEMAAVHGGSIYVDGSYWGEGDLNTRPWPNGVPVKVIWDLGKS